MMRPINIAIVIVVLLLAVFLSTMHTSAMRDMKKGFLSFMSPFSRTGNEVQKQVTSVSKELKSVDQLETENVTLTTENKKLLAENQILRDIEQENQKLRAALDYRERSVFKLLPARIISRDASAWWNTVKINRGFEDGIESDMTVLTENGLVGKTITPAKNETTVLLITDENCKIAVKIEGTNEQGILQGARVQSADRPELRLNFLTKNAALQEGQKVYTVGVNGGVFPPQIPLGIIHSFRVRELDTQAIVTPAVDIPRVEDVFVVVGTK